jgi:hypothetical protein
MGWQRPPYALIELKRRRPKALNKDAEQFFLLASGTPTVRPRHEL